MTPIQQAAKNAWDTYLKDWYVNNKGETKPTYASKWRTSNPGNAQKILAYKNGTGPRPLIGDGYGPMIVNVVDILLIVQEPPPPPPKTTVAPRTFNKEGGSDARFCVKDLPRDPNRSNIPFDDYTHYDNDGRDLDGGRDPDFIAHKVDGTPLRGAKSMDNFGPCDLYDGLTEWPPESYHR